MNNQYLEVCENDLKALVDFFRTLLEWHLDIIGKGECYE
jgi:hypothetical protein